MTNIMIPWDMVQPKVSILYFTTGKNNSIFN